jgi:molybdate transport system ATP-binding protein
LRLALTGVRLVQGDFTLALDVVVEGSLVAVCGPSGAGKTTLLELIAGLRRPRAGMVTLDGERLDGDGVHLHAAARRLGYVPQDGALFPHFDVRGNLFYGAGRARAGGVARVGDPTAGDGPSPAQVIDVLGLADLLDRPVEGLSGGERQRVALGRALLSGSRLLLLDEPLASLDEALRRRIRSWLLRIRDELGVPMFYVTHEARDVAELAEVVLHLERGRLVAAGAPQDLLEHDADAVRFRSVR